MAVKNTKNKDRNIRTDLTVPNTDPNIGTTPITPEDLTTNESPFNIKSPKINTEGAALGGIIQSNTDAFTADLEARRKESETAKNRSLQDYLKGKLDTSGETQMTAREYARPGSVDELSGELADINQKILAEQQALTRTLEKYEAGGGLASGAAAEAANAERTSLRKQADLSLIQLGIQGKYDSAKAIADRAVAIQLERDKIKNEALQVQYEDNKEQFTKDEQREFETKQGDRERELNLKEQDLERKYALALDAQQNGAPSSIVQQMLEAESAAKALSTGGGYVGLLDRQAKYASIASSNTSRLLALAEAGDTNAIKQLGFDPTKVKAEPIDPTTKRNLEDKVAATEKLIELSDQYKSIIDTYGYTNEFFGDSNIIGTINSLRTQITAAYKAGEQLGTLDTGVLKLVEGILGESPVSTVGGVLLGEGFTENITGKKSKKISASLDSLIQTAITDKAKAQLRLGIDPVTAANIPVEDMQELDAYLGITNEEDFDPNSYYQD